MENKHCHKCKTFKPVSMFSKRSRALDGLQDTCKACSSDYHYKENDMKQSRVQAILRSQTEMAKRVFDCVPITEPWSAHQIGGEMRRLTGSPVDHHTLKGCINSLIRCGLVKERTTGLFQRTRITDAREGDVQKEQEFIDDLNELLSAPDDHADPITIQSETEMQAQAPTTATNAANSTPLEKIGKLSGQVIMLMTELKVLHDAIETVAIEVEEQFATRDAESQKLKQLQLLLKGLV